MISLDTYLTDIYLKNKYNNEQRFIYKTINQTDFI